VNTQKPEPIIAPIPVERLEKELDKIRHDYLLFESSNFKVYFAPASEMPEILTEIGRLREVTFREVGEGTNKSIDLDDYDKYYNHLFIWDENAKCVVGAYRIGKGKDILPVHGRKGFYIDTLFELTEAFEPVLREGLEMGRSFISKEYQRRPNSLFLLWKGVLYILLKNPDFRYMFATALQIFQKTLSLNII